MPNGLFYYIVLQKNISSSNICKNIYVKPSMCAMQQLNNKQIKKKNNRGEPVYFVKFWLFFQ